MSNFTLLLDSLLYLFPVQKHEEDRKAAAARKRAKKKRQKEKKQLLRYMYIQTNVH